MKKIIDGKMYNTETAARIGCWSNGCYQSDFNYYSEDLYKKKTGEYFLHKEGGALSCMAEYSGSGYSSGESIKQMHESSAKVWCMSKLDADEYESIFGAVEE